MEIVAHRGACFDAPENSRAAISLAASQFAPRVEFDVRGSSDGTPVVVHDETTGRVADRDVVVGRTSLADLRALRLANDETLPTLEELLDVTPGGVQLDVELKVTDRGVVEATAAALRAAGRWDDATWVTSFEAEALEHMKACGFPGRLGLIAGSKKKRWTQQVRNLLPLRHLRRSVAHDLIIHHLLLFSRVARLARAEGYGLVVWSGLPDEERPEAWRSELYRKMIRFAPEGVIVGRVAEARAVLGLSTEAS